MNGHVYGDAQVDTESEAGRAENQKPGVWNAIKRYCNDKWNLVDWVSSGALRQAGCRGPARG
jgi:hypothetical protein